MSYRKEFIETLVLLSRAFRIVEKQGGKPPVIVGGAAVEYYTAGNIVSGDFDIIYENLALLSDALVSQGFVQEDRLGHINRGFYHPTLLTAVEVVSGPLFDGKTDEERLALVPIDDGSVIVPPIEDIIADRLAQYEASICRDNEMLEQARILLKLAENLDRDYLFKRLNDEVVDQKIVFLLGVF